MYFMAGAPSDVRGMAPRSQAGRRRPPVLDMSARKDRGEWRADGLTYRLRSRCRSISTRIHAPRSIVAGSHPRSLADGAAETSLATVRDLVSGQIDLHQATAKSRSVERGRKEGFPVVVRRDVKADRLCAHVGSWSAMVSNENTSTWF
jgi:hypothetical protein